VLTGLIVLLFLGLRRSTLIVATSIPLSILCSILALSWARADHQRHDAGRPRAGGRHLGR
jgi:Cu/Ag efflux pump CusA